MPQLPKAYTPHDVEGAIYERWLAADVFAPDGAGSTADPALPPFTIIQPPPNITGSLHLGHAQRTAVEDLMIRHARMRGHRTLFLPGLDHASIAAQFVLDGILAKEGESRQTLGRDRYLERMREFVATTREVMLGQQRRVGGSFDWGRLRLHDGRSVGEGRARRVQTPVRRRPRVSDRGARQLVPGLPDERQRPRGHLDARDRHALVGPLPPDRPGDRRARTADADRSPIATTRPETILGDTAVAVHPDDPRYARARRPDGPHPVRRARRPDHRRRRRRPGVRDGRGQDHAGPRPRRPPDRAAPRPPGPDDPGRRRDDHRHRHAATTGWTASRRARRSSPTSRPAAISSRTSPRDGPRALPAQQRRHRAAPQDPVVRPDRAARGTGARGDPSAAGRASSRSGSRRPGSTG